MNKNLPIHVDGEKRIETTVVVGETIIIKYKFTDDSVVKSPRFRVSKYISGLRQTVGKDMCSKKDTRRLLNRGATYSYIFTDKYGMTLFEYNLNSAECQKIQ